MARVAVRNASVISPGVSVLSILSVSLVFVDFRVFSVDFRRCMEVMFFEVPETIDHTCPPIFRALEACSATAFFQISLYCSY